MLSDLKYFEGSLKQINRVPEHIKNKFKQRLKWNQDSLLKQPAEDKNG